MGQGCRSNQLDVLQREGVCVGREGVPRGTLRAMPATQAGPTLCTFLEDKDSEGVADVSPAGCVSSWAQGVCPIMQPPPLPTGGPLTCTCKAPTPAAQHAACGVKGGGAQGEGGSVEGSHHPVHHAGRPLLSRQPDGKAAALGGTGVGLGGGERDRGSRTGRKPTACVEAGWEENRPGHMVGEHPGASCSTLGCPMGDPADRHVGGSWCLGKPFCGNRSACAHRDLPDLPRVDQVHHTLHAHCSNDTSTAAFSSVWAAVGHKPANSKLTVSVCCRDSTSGSPLGRMPRPRAIWRRSLARRAISTSLLRAQLLPDTMRHM